MNKITKKIILLGILSVFLITVFFTFSLDFLEDKQEFVEIPMPNSLFTITAPASEITYDYNTKFAQYVQAEFALKNDYFEIYEKIGFLNQESNTAVIYPTFTESAYSENGFYEYFETNCDESCITVSIQENFEGEYESSRAAYRILGLLGYEQLTDIDLDNNPEIITKYDKVILLHNEYVTKSMFDAITSHPNVVYLYPNALYAQISVDYDAKTISLVKGHGFPEKSIDNGFNWIFDNTRPYEFDNQCNDWEFIQISNGYMLNCYPEYVIFKDQKLLETIKDL